MIFEKRFQELMDRLDNSLACMLMGFDGINVVSVLHPDSDLDLELMGAEISVMVSQLRQASFTSQFGKARELVLNSTQTKVLLQVLTEDYFIVLVMRPEAHIGKGRFLLSLLESDLVQELE